MKVKRNTTIFPLRRRQYDLLNQTTQRFARFFHRFALTKAPDQARHPIAISLRHPRMKPQRRSGGRGRGQLRLFPEISKLTAELLRQWDVCEGVVYRLAVV
jgi:hypothetical protein